MHEIVIVSADDFDRPARLIGQWAWRRVGFPGGGDLFIQYRQNMRNGRQEHDRPL
jgi:hypothetical protein